MFVYSLSHTHTYSATFMQETVRALLVDGSVSLEHDISLPEYTSITMVESIEQAQSHLHEKELLPSFPGHFYLVPDIPIDSGGRKDSRYRGTPLQGDPPSGSS